MFNFFI